MPAKILIVDDESSARLALENLLIAEEYAMQFADSGAAGLTLAADWQPDVILCDVMMPEMDGFAFCQRVRANPCIAQVPILLVTALNDRESKLRGLEAGADDFLSKPFDSAELRARVRTTIRLNRYRQIVTERTRLLWMLEHSPEGYLILAPDGQIQFANARARLYLGLSDPSTTPLPHLIAWARRQYQLEPASAWQTWGTAPDATPRYLVRPETTTAQAFWLLVQTLAMPTTDASEQLVLLRDISDQVLTQRRWVSFAQALSHKLRTPVGNIYSIIDLWHATAQDLTKTELLKMLPLAYDAAVRLKDQLDDIMQYLYAPPAPGSGVCLSIAEVSKLVTTTSQALKLPVTIHIAADARALALPLPAQTMETILWEIFENARKFHPRHTPQVQVHITRQADQVRLQFWDDGVTLSPEQLARAWVPFFQGEKYQTGEIAGMGLGLAMVALFIWNVGGTYQLFNRTDQPGTIVELCMPVNPPA